MKPERTAELIQMAIDEGAEGYTLAEVLTEIVEGRSALFKADNSILVASLYRHHDTHVAHGWLGAGDLTEILEIILPQAERWSRGQGATRMTVDGRRGWVRALKRAGFAEESVTVGKVL